ncbi:glycosyltransferase [Gordonia sp. CPCC 205515]|uniref:glycosyltransferase n=1 Tax=Gordonia sp. CPCC 205515 TaxID=3140791 RepID=UPI003AF34F90
MTSVVAVIASYEPGDEIVDVVKRVSEQVDSVIIVDDGSSSLLDGATGPVRQALDNCAAIGATILENPTNLGIAHALNCGVRLALERGADAVLTLDQDTHVGDDFIARTLDHLALASSLGLTRIMLSPSVINGEVAQFWYAEKGLTLAYEPIQSGLVVTREVFDTVGLFDEDLFIDCVDTEFYLRVRAAGGHALVVPGAQIRHSFGRPARWTPPGLLKRLFSGTGGAGVEFTEDAPFRHYYIARNRLALYLRYARSEPLWCASSIYKDTTTRGRAMIIGSRRRSRIYLTSAGIGAALRGEMGRIPDRTLRRAGAWSRADR